MRQGERALVHFVNLSGHSLTAFFTPAPMADIRVAPGGRPARRGWAGHCRSPPAAGTPASRCPGWWTTKPP